MIEKIKSLGNLPLVIMLVIVVIIAIVLSIFKTQKSEETNADTKLSDTTKVEQSENKENEEEQLEEIIIDENIEEIVDETEEEEQNSDANYFIRVNYGQNVVTIYTKDSNGEYTVPYKAMVCSTGTATPRSGTYTIPSGTYSRGTWGLMKGNVWAQYFTRIHGSILFHSVPYTARNKWSLEYWEYDKLGTAASLGCIRLTVENAKWIYNNCPAGTQVEFYTDSNPGPLVPESPQKISEEEEVRGWDPTDPDSANPWRTYEPDKEKEPEETKKEPAITKPTTNTKPNKNPTTNDTKPEEEKPKEDTPEQNQGGEITTPNEGNQSGEINNPNEGNQSGENQNPEETPGEETTNPDEGKVEEPGTPPVQQEPATGDGENSEENTGNNNEEDEKQEGTTEKVPDAPVENGNPEGINTHANNENA